MVEPSDGTRLWLVERDYDDRGLVRLVYATPDGCSHLRKELSGAALRRSAVTAATTVDTDRLEPVDDPDTRERYAAEADRMRSSHAPGDEV
ncbi:MAG: hypothetical protein ABEH56_04050 [Salinirussus sp.]